DSSPMYGSSEQVVGELLAARPAGPRAWLATKVWTTGERAGIDQMHTSLRRLGADPIDLMQIHNLVDWRTHLRTLRAWKAEGRVRTIGLTHYQASAHDDLAQAIQSEAVDVVQVNLSLDEPEAASALLAACARRGVGVIVNRPFGGGASFAKIRTQPLPPWVAQLGVASWAQFMLTWILSFPEVTCVIPGTRRAAHVVDNLGAGRLAPLSGAVRDRMAAAWRRLAG
ncbi:MAG: aldo/keto reductase, partial [Gemmatimonadetes bacterium]|nr:aldo/keto reductase [Gemmatimonadota bacterium]